MISQSYVHSCTFECMHVSTHTSPRWTPCDVRSTSAPVAFLPQGIMLGRYFRLLGWLLDMVFIWTGNLFSFESIYSKKTWSTAEGSGHQERASICPDMKNMGRRWTPWRVKWGKCISLWDPSLEIKNNNKSDHFYWWWKNTPNICCIYYLQWIELVCKLSERPGYIFFLIVSASFNIWIKWTVKGSRLQRIAYPPALPRRGSWNVIGVKWELSGQEKAEYSHSFGWHLGDCSHSWLHWYALYYVLLTRSLWQSTALTPSL